MLKARQLFLLFKQDTKYHIAHTESSRRNPRAAKYLKKIIVPPPTGDGPERRLHVKTLVHNARIVCQPAHDAWVILAPLCNAELLEPTLKIPQRLARR